MAGRGPAEQSEHRHQRLRHRRLGRLEGEFQPGGAVALVVAQPYAHQPGHVAAMEGPAVQAAHPAGGGDGQGGERNARRQLDNDLPLQRRCHLLPGRGGAHTAYRDALQPGGARQGGFGEVVRGQLHLSADAHGLLEPLPSKGLLWVILGEADLSGEPDRVLPVRVGSVGCQVHDRTAVGVQGCVHHVERGDLLGPSMRRRPARGSR